ncbi:MAG: hypothetical protein C4575_07045 [Desulforudis sp.]|nr:MAG: hypothetical protein C4575_07045 [Desulforudis sp.]
MRKGILLSLVTLLFVMVLFAPTAHAEYSDGDVIFAEDLPVGAILTGFTVSGNGATNVAREAVVVRSGQSPRLVLTSNHGSYSIFGANNNYNTSTLKSKIDSLSFSIAEFITNVSAPSLIDVTDGFSYNSVGYVFLGELRTEIYWTRSPFESSGSFHYAFYVDSNGYVFGEFVSYSFGVRPAFNLKSDTVLRREVGKFRITTDPADYLAAHYRKYGDLYRATNAAKTAAVDAKNAADTASARVWDSAESKSAATLAKEARDRANQALTEINNVKNMVNNIQASVGPQINRVQGLNGATATTTSSFTVVVDASGATEFRARREGGTWTGWASVDNSLSVSGLTVGVNTIQVEVRNASGATATGRMIAFRL